MEYSNTHIGWEEWNSLKKEDQDKEIEKAIKQIEHGDLEDPCDRDYFEIITRYPRDESKSKNGGDYKEWDEYYSIPGKQGFYAMFSETSCDFDHVGTGFEGVVSLSEDDYQCLRIEQDLAYQEAAKDRGEEVDDHEV